MLLGQTWTNSLFPGAIRGITSTVPAFRIVPLASTGPIHRNIAAPGPAKRSIPGSRPHPARPAPAPGTRGTRGNAPRPGDMIVEGPGDAVRVVSNATRRTAGGLAILFGVFRWASESIHLRMRLENQSVLLNCIVLEASVQKKRFYIILFYSPKMGVSE